MLHKPRPMSKITLSQLDDSPTTGNLAESSQVENQVGEENLKISHLQVDSQAEGMNNNNRS